MINLGLKENGKNSAKINPRAAIIGSLTNNRTEDLKRIYNRECNSTIQPKRIRRLS